MLVIKKALDLNITDDDIALEPTEQFDLLIDGYFLIFMTKLPLLS